MKINYFFFFRKFSHFEHISFCDTCNHSAIENFHILSHGCLIKCFLIRAFIVCSNWFTFHEEISKLKNIFHMNGYPKDIYNHVEKFLSKKLMTTNSCQNMIDEKKHSYHTI